MFMLSILEIPIGVRKRLDFFNQDYFGKMTTKRRNIN
jgi:hypothetical protein